MAYLEVVTPQAFTNTAGLRQIPDITSDLVLDFDPDSITGVANGAPIATLTSQGSNPMALSTTVGTSITKPVLNLGVSEINGHASLGFAGAQNIRVVGTAAIFTAAQPSTQIVVCKPTGAADSRIVMGTAAGSGYRGIGQENGRAFATTSSGSTPATTYELAGELGAWRVLVARWDTTAQKLNSSREAGARSSAVAAGPLSGVTIGSSHTGASPYTGQIARVQHFGRLLTDAEVSAIIDVMCSRYGITRTA